MSTDPSWNRNRARRTKWLNRVARQHPETKRLILERLGADALRSQPLPPLTFDGDEDEDEERRTQPPVWGFLSP